MSALGKSTLAVALLGASIGAFMCPPAQIDMQR